MFAEPIQVFILVLFFSPLFYCYHVTNISYPDAALIGQTVQSSSPTWPLKSLTYQSSYPFRWASSSTSTSTTTADPFEYDYTDSRNGRLLDRRNKNNCPSLRMALPNGWVRLRSNNRIARFSCNDGFDLIGNRLATCIRGRWNKELPICVSSGCLKIIPHAPLKVKRLYSGNVLDLSCDLGYYINVNISGQAAAERESNELIPAQQIVSSFPFSILRVYCVGKTWRMDDPRADISGLINRIPISSIPSCEIYESPVVPSMNCTFEESLCGWFQDHDDDFNWLRNHHTTPSNLDGTGPSWDHTFGRNNSGYYLYLESSYPRVPNEVARLFSPVYTHLQGTSDACFTFYYHMYGKAIGGLRVFVLEKSQVLKELLPKFELVGDQGDSWFKAQIEINSQAGTYLRPFQLVFEGQLGHGHQGDIAIDDLLLTLGQNCTNYNSSMELAPDLVADINAEMTNVTSEIPRPEELSSTTTKDVVAVSSSTETPVSSSTAITPKPKNGTSLQKIIDHINTHIIPNLLKKKVPTTTTVSPAVTSLSPVSPSPSIRPTHLPVDWLKKLQEKMNDTMQKINGQQATLLSEWHNSTLPSVKTSEPEPTTVVTVAVTTESPVPAPRPTSAQTSSLSYINDHPKHSTKLFASSTYLSVLMLLVLLVIVVSTLYIAYVYRPAKLNRSNLDQFVASFVRRCKGFRPGAEEADDAELLMMANGNGSGAEGGSGDILAYDNAHMNEGVVYLHSTNEKY